MILFDSRIQGVRTNNCVIIRTWADGRPKCGPPKQSYVSYHPSYHSHNDANTNYDKEVLSERKMEESQMAEDPSSAWTV